MIGILYQKILQANGYVKNIGVSMACFYVLEQNAGLFPEEYFCLRHMYPFHLSQYAGKVSRETF